MTKNEMGKRFPIKLPVWHEKRLIWWAAMKGTTKSSLAINVLQCRVEANEQQIEAMLADRAKDLGLTVDELKSQILKENKFNPGTESDDVDD